MEYRGVNTGEKSLSFHNRAIQDLTRLIQRDDRVNKNELLAAIMLLVYYEVVSMPAPLLIFGNSPSDIGTSLSSAGDPTLSMDISKAHSL